MKRVIIIFVLFFCLFVVFVFYVKKRTYLSNKPVRIEYFVDNFVLRDHRGVFHEFYDYTDKKALILIAQGNGCFINQQLAPYLNLLKEEYEPKGAKFLMINANLQDDQISIFREAEDYDIEIPILMDRAQVISADLNIHQAGEALVFNPADWSLVYRGAIVKKTNSKTTKEKIEEHYIRDAIDALLQGKLLTVSKTQTEGCMINMEKIFLKKEISFVKDVAPVLINRCLPCHNEERDDVWTINDYEMVKSYSSLIRDVIRTKRMPPWKGDESLSPEEIRTLVRWVEQGAHRGEGSDPLKSYLSY